MFSLPITKIFFDKIPYFLELLNNQFLIIGIILGIIGAFCFYKNNKRTFGFVFLAFLGEFIYAINYNISDIKVYYIPLYLIFVIFISISLNKIMKTKKLLIKLLIIFLIIMNFVFLFSYNYQNLKVNINNYDWKKMINVVGRDGIIAYKSGVNNYADWMVALYYKYGEDFDKKYNIHIKSIKKIKKDCLFTSDLPIYFFEGNLGNTIEFDNFGKKLDKWGVNYKKCGVSLSKFIKRLDKNDIVIISIKDEGTSALNNDILNQFKKLGLDADLLGKYRWSYAAVGVNSSHEAKGKGNLAKHKVELTINEGEYIGKTNIRAPVDVEIISAGMKSGNISQIYVDGRQVSRNERGMNIVVLDSKTGNIKQNINVDTLKTNIINPYYKVIPFSVNQIKIFSAGLKAGNFARMMLNGKNDVSKNERGFNVTVISSEGKLKSIKNFDTHASKKESKKFASFIKKVNEGNIVAITIKDEASNSLTSEAIQALHFIGAKAKIKGKYRWSYAVIGRKGAEIGTAIEKLAKNKPVEINYSLK